MTFTAFQDIRSGLLRVHSDLLDCAETNLYRSLAHLALPPTPAPDRKVHRCHLAAEWLSCFGIDVPPNRALVSCGVRDSLARLFAHYAGLGAMLWLPEDNYPAYAELACNAGLRFNTFETLPEPMWPVSTDAAGFEVLLVTNPIKPRSRWLDAVDVGALKGWLLGSPNRRLLLDAVYVFDTHFDPLTLELVSTDQVILLHSLTKGWLHPRLFGIALVPEQDVEQIGPWFRANPPSQDALARARQMLGPHANLPAAISDSLAAARVAFHASLPLGLGGFLSADAPGYLLPVELPWQRLFDEYRIIGIPASVFGSSHENMSILSTLTFLP
jgi:histidinol-phosphate/aromatic aminotransferase/cobyric acid decarboxylase-like protein